MSVSQPTVRPDRLSGTLTSRQRVSWSASHAQHDCLANHRVSPAEGACHIENRSPAGPGQNRATAKARSSALSSGKPPATRPSPPLDTRRRPGTFCITARATTVIFMQSHCTSDGGRATARHSFQCCPSTPAHCGCSRFGHDPGGWMPPHTSRRLSRAICEDHPRRRSLFEIGSG